MVRAPGHTDTYRRGFTLIELSIVLVIIGLIAGGVLVGRTMIRQSQLRTITADVEKFQTAVHTFRLKYNCQPGDCVNATSFWGTNPNCATNGLGTGTQTCDGDGNKWTDLQINTAQHMEQYTFWQHLSNAQLISGVYTGQSNTYSICSININCPAGKINNSQAYWYAAYRQSPGSTDWWPHPKLHFLIVGTQGASGYPGRPLITAQEAFSIDSKMDDGKPGLGKWMMFAGGGYNPDCAVDSTDGTVITNATTQQQVAIYNTSNSGITCAFRVFMQ